ncbi:MAG: hypothetical protein ACYDH6_23660 [Acidimicrobiales bacterium]
MGRGDRAVRRWKNDRIRTKKLRAQRKAATVRTAVAEPTAPPTAP